MCLLKVASRRDSGDYVRRNSRSESTATTATATASTNLEGGQQQQQQPQQQQEFGQSRNFLTAEELQQLEQTDYLLSMAAPMFPAYSQTREMSEIVAALTNVVSGQRSSAGELNFNRPELISGGGGAGAGGAAANSPSSAYSSSSSGSWAGQKRGRGDQDDTVSGFPERVFRGFDEFRAGDSSSSAIPPGN